jgi:hypothetical protein
LIRRFRRAAKQDKKTNNKKTKDKIFYCKIEVELQRIKRVIQTIKMPSKISIRKQVPGLKTALETAVNTACSGVVLVGKYKGYTYAEVSFDKRYCTWVLALPYFNGDNQFHAWLKLRHAVSVM